MSYREIPLTQGYVTIIDEEDYERVSQYKWRVQKNGKGRLDGAISNKAGKEFGITQIRLHRFILNNPDSAIDHIDENVLNNRKENLRNASIAENNRNRSKYKKDATSKFKGVSWNKRARKWEVRLGIKEKLLYLGCFINEIEAAKAYNKAAIKYHGEFANLNEIPEGN